MGLCVKTSFTVLKQLLGVYVDLRPTLTLITGDPLHSRALAHSRAHCSHSRAPIVHTAVPRENNEHGCVYLRCRAVCKLPGCVEGHPCLYTTLYSPSATLLGNPQDRVDMCAGTECKAQVKRTSQFFTVILSNRN